MLLAAVLTYLPRLCQKQKRLSQKHFNKVRLLRQPFIKRIIRLRDSIIIFSNDPVSIANHALCVSSGLLPSGDRGAVVMPNTHLCIHIARPARRIHPRPTRAGQMAWQALLLPQAHPDELLQQTEHQRQQNMLATL